MFIVLKFSELKFEADYMFEEVQKRFRGGLVFKAHRWLYHSTLGSRVIKKKRRRSSAESTRVVNIDV